MIRNFIVKENLHIKDISIITVDDEYLKKLHNKYLKDNSYTDVMTFKLDEKGAIEAEIYLGVEQAKSHAHQYGVSLNEEIARLIIHGLLHLKGFDDTTEKKREQMYQLENEMLRKYWS
jgi:probable rRNA maturation factor